VLTNAQKTEKEHAVEATVLGAVNLQMPFAFADKNGFAAHHF
jgi:hypothetical protein